MTALSPPLGEQTRAQRLTSSAPHPPASQGAHAGVKCASAGRVVPPTHQRVCARTPYTLRIQPHHSLSHLSHTLSSHLVLCHHTFAMADASSSAVPTSTCLTCVVTNPGTRHPPPPPLPPSHCHHHHRRRRRRRLRSQSSLLAKT
ncbi:hypothetical protein LX32DRAFT_305002 [Colletotrichum zoysiae]|uniref:Uncharacterized protein n=1 Tax=Colletotrichum zoysiae TaxID=1216348 RepID=A0AAD9H1G6_9PEZI|nr:hypothetical protein LX32DRAFT_305002 [Colletotrichum zoysiae]